MEYQDFLKRINEIKQMKYVKSHRVGDTGIGKTLEYLLGITENNIAGPDFATYELKSARKESVSMLTLFTKAPLPDSANMNLLATFGYAQRKKTNNFKQLALDRTKIDELKIPLGDKELHVTVDAIQANSVGLKLGIEDDKILIENKKGVLAYWDNRNLQNSFEKKYNRLIYVLADNKKEKGEEYFWFNEVLLLDGFSFARFSELIKEGKLKVDIRIGHHANGRLHDHGTGFRILPKYLPQCFQKIERIL